MVGVILSRTFSAVSEAETVRCIMTQRDGSWGCALLSAICNGSTAPAPALSASIITRVAWKARAYPWRRCCDRQVRCVAEALARSAPTLGRGFGSPRPEVEPPRASTNGPRLGLVHDQRRQQPISTAVLQPDQSSMVYRAVAAA